MIKLGVIADSHRNEANIREALRRLEDCALIIHLGDHDTDIDGFRLPETRLLSVPGNCDPFSFAPASRIFEREGVRVFMTHGDAYGVKYSLVRLRLKAQETGSALVLYGHSHQQRVDRDGNVVLLNPGALKNGDYSVVTLKDGRISWELINLSDRSAAEGIKRR